MARNTSITLGDHFDQFISRLLGEGRYGSASEVIRAGLRLLEENETRLELLRDALLEGERSGGSNYSYESILEELDQMKVSE